MWSCPPALFAIAPSMNPISHSHGRRRGSRALPSARRNRIRPASFSRGSYLVVTSIQRKIRATSGARDNHQEFNSTAIGCPRAISSGSQGHFHSATRSTSQARSTARATPPAMLSNGCYHPCGLEGHHAASARSASYAEGRDGAQPTPDGRRSSPANWRDFCPNWHFFTHAQNDSYQPSAYDSDVPQLAVRTFQSRWEPASSRVRFKRPTPASSRGHFRPLMSLLACPSSC